ncbi:MAG: hypothetical protein QOD39_5180 [Mycobacterium sp.]|jgi:FkbM family methyltransferase|nr:hypothetical protein [Mycobacterium sp.]
MRNRAAKAGKLARILPVRAWRRALVRHRVAAGVEHAGVLRRMPGLRTIVDVGANRGQFALAARLCHPEARVVSFEPLAGPAATYRAVFGGDVRTSLINAALGPTSGEAVIHVSGRDDSSSLLPITAAQDTLFPGTAQVDTDTVRVTRLAEHLAAGAIEAPALLKIDVQGFELQALAGCEDVLDRFDWIYAECSFVELYAGQAFADDVIAWLRERGFALRGVYHMSYDAAGNAVQADFLFARR